MIICAECLTQWPRISMRDEGIGVYHYGSIRGRHEDWVRFTECCGSSEVYDVDIDCAHVSEVSLYDRPMEDWRD